MLVYATSRVPWMFISMLRRESWLRQQIQRRIIRAAQRRAFQHFAQRYPQWAASLFDDFFLTHSAAPLFDRYMTPAQRPAASDLASAWAIQYPAPRSSAAPLDLADATKAAAAFLRLVDAELEPYQLLLV